MRIIFGTNALMTLLFCLSSLPAIAKPQLCQSLFKEKKIDSERANNTRKKIGLDVSQRSDILAVGDKVLTPGGHRLKVEKVILDGHKGLVYKVINSSGKAFALKVPRYDLAGFNYDVIASLQKEVGKVESYAALDVPFARIYEYGKDYLLKEWVEGLRGDAWAEEWASLTPSQRRRDLRYRQLLELFDRIASQGVYIGNLKSINLIHDGQNWVVVDGGSPKYEMGSPDEIRRDYRRVFESRWIKDLDLQR